ncbi:MAG TPA: hypothetical protein VMT00_01010 [Thermoanaerobaculia bacterium]|nr:hypothetical protein [Thermoanaerobaculia bacterium]
MESAQKRTLGIALLAIAIAFVAGYVPSSVGARKAARENDRLELELSLARLHGTLGMTSYEANRNNFATAAEWSTRFFEGLKSIQENPVLQQDPARLAAVRRISLRRDEITSELARPDPEVRTRLAELYAEFEQVAPSAR